ncbi:MAG TPA: hypothetical protein VIH59_03475 [Candidatus Tectomicrobia bacterium]|jgi:hypothetical protein
MQTRRALCLSLLIALLLTPVYTAATQNPEARVLAHIRQATAHLHHLKTAQAVGYAQFRDCVAEPGEGAMGIHFVHGELISDTVLDPILPEALMYEPLPNGWLRLVGVEYIVFQAAWDAEHTAPPVLLGQQFHLVPSPNRYDVPAFYALHVWVWKHNPGGLFNDWNPRVQCPED